MYGRLDRDKKFADEVSALRGDRTDIYPVTVEVKEGHGHGDLPDRDFLAGMTSATRNPVPRDLTWLMTDGVITDFFWLHTERAGQGAGDRRHLPRQPDHRHDHAERVRRDGAAGQPPDRLRQAGHADRQRQEVRNAV